MTSKKLLQQKLLYTRWPYGVQGTGHAHTPALRVSGDWPHLHGGYDWFRGPATAPRRPYGAQGDGHTGHRGPATPKRRPYGAQGTGHTITVAIRA